MNPNTNSSGMINDLSKNSQESKKIGPIVAVLVVILVIIIGVLFFFNQKLNTNTDATPSVQPTDVSSDYSASNNASVINADLDNQLKDIDYSF